MSGRVCLLTFRSLPCLFGSNVSAELKFEFNNLTADCAFFEMHYLQRTGFSSILDAPDLQCLRDASDISVGCRIDEAAPSITVPNWLNPTGDHCESSVDDLSNRDFFWWHVDDEINAANLHKFQSAVEYVQDASPTQRVVIITAIGGVPEASDSDFESLLWESEIRVPLWILKNDAFGSRVQQLTGSDDVTHTICHALEIPPDRQEQPVGTKRRVNLLSSASQDDRDLLIERDGIQSIRTSEFLFVQTVTDNDDDFGAAPTSALYAKPEDVWNVNDVSTEYHEIADQMQQLIAQRNKPNVSL